MKATMKQRMIKGILAATLALTTVVSVPQFPLNAKSDNTITAYAACSHNYRHYGSWGEWHDSGDRQSVAGHSFKVYERHYYSVCVNCGKRQFVIKTETRLVW